MDVDIDKCIERVKFRNQCFPGYTPDEIDIRCEKVDRVNAWTVLLSKNRADVIVKSAAVSRRTQTNLEYHNNPQSLPQHTVHL
jgi:hypothetical protein